VAQLGNVDHGRIEKEKETTLDTPPFLLVHPAVSQNIKTALIGILGYK